MHDFFPYLAKPTVTSRWPHGTLDSLVAHQTVRCDLVTVGSAHVTAGDRAPTVGTSESRWPSGSPNSPVNYNQYD
jgi:hypothetical protein